MYKHLKYMSTKDMTHEEWEKMRQGLKTIGGSDAPTICGMNEYSSPFALWSEKTGQFPPEDLSDKEAVRLGTDLEEYVARRFTEKTGKKVRRCNAVITNPDFPFAHANVDRVVVGEDAILECKTTSSWEIASQCKAGQIPDRYYAQCVHYMMVTGVPRVYLGVLVFGTGFYDFVIERDENEIDALMDAEKDFWRHVVTNTPPSVDGTEPTTKAIKNIFTGSSDTVVDLFGMDSALRQYMELGKQIKDLSEAQDSIANSVKLAMGENGKAECAGFKVSWAAQTRNTFDAKKFASEHPEMDLRPYYKSSSSRPFKVTVKK